MGKTRGRNDPCWCGSGKKYKKCHLNRHREKRIRPWEAEQQYRKFFGAKYCSCPDGMKHQCAGTIVKAHTVSKSSSLQKISRDGHVYGLAPSFANLDEGQGTLVPELVGVNRASTFTGFCGFHDKSLFSEFEDNAFVGSAKQAFLIGYRSLCRECFTKRAQNDLHDTYNELDKGRSESAQWSIQTFAFLHSIGVRLGVRDIEAHKSIYDDVLLSGQFDNVRAYVIEFEDVLPIACSGAFYPESNFNGDRLQDFSEMDAMLDNLCFSIFTSETLSYAVFTWLDDSEPSCKRFIDSLTNTSEQRLFPVLVQFACATFENVFFAPGWWEALPDGTQAELVQLLASGASPSVPADDDTLVDKGLHLGQYNVACQFGISTSNNAINKDA